MMRESLVSGHSSVSSTLPIARFTEEEKRVSVIKAPHYEGIGPVDETGIPIAIRTVRKARTHIRRLTQLHTDANTHVGPVFMSFPGRAGHCVQLTHAPGISVVVVLPGAGGEQGGGMLRAFVAGPSLATVL